MPAPAVKSRTSRYVGIAIAVVAVVSGAVFLAKQKANPLSATANLVQNPSFENVSASGFPVGWKYTVWKGEAAWNVADRASAHAGSRALHVVAPSGGGDTRVVTTAAVKVKRGADYRLSAWVRTKGVSGARGAYVNADLPSRNGGDEKNQAPLYYSRGIIGDTNWTLLEKVISVGDDDEVGISCALGGWGLCLGEAWFDDVSFTEIPRPTAPILSKSPDAVSAAPAAAK